MFLVVIQLGAVLAVVVLILKIMAISKNDPSERVTGTISVRMSVSGNCRNLQTNTST